MFTLSETLDRLREIQKNICHFRAIQKRKACIRGSQRLHILCFPDFCASKKGQERFCYTNGEFWVSKNRIYRIFDTLTTE